MHEAPVESSTHLAAHTAARRRRPPTVAAVLTAIVTALAWLVASPASPASAATAPLVSATSGRCLDVKGNVDTLGTILDIWDCNGQANQAFEFTSAGELRTLNGTRCVDAYNNQTSPGTQVVIWSCNGQNNQKWRQNSDGSITGVQSGLCLDVDHAGTANGTAVILWTCNGQSNQKWSTTTGGGDTLVVDASSVVRPVTRVGSGTLYGLADANTPPVSIMQPLKLHQLRQPPPLHEHRPNGSPVPIGDTLNVWRNAAAIGAVITVDMADSFDGFPYNWTNWNDWYSRIDKMIAAAKSAGVTNIDAWEPWNEPDWTWPSASGVSFNDGWVRTYQRIRQSEPNTAIMGPSYSYWDVNRMRSFLTNAKATNTVPQVVSWHELGGWRQVTANVQAYRNLERELGISPRPISINEYASTSEIDVPSSANHYVAQFERAGVRDAERAFWYEAGTLNGLLYNGQPTASYWMYKWYGDQTGNIVKVTPTTSNDGVAAYDAGSRTLSVVFGGQSGNSSIRVDGIGGLGSSVTATLESVPGSGRTTNVSGPTRVWSNAYTVTNGSVTIPIANQNASGAYRLVLTPR
ncbi:ricin-type beta-trefoil lectin domain protein [Microbispora sp. NEAU-D428]|uniref:RICIN domain-containing protein n=1 Tax=Microbispora sitophila TaxID=2771537 RepID=UPI0018672A8C|nr:RICIN domain-containing protein [Microbispora sitophila]MBE3011878.1 ricin-type beta-trefoil lectin domain protein [Microbispora sitophila]